MSAKNSPRFAASSLPHADAPVDEVRAYISLLLHTKLQVPAAEADTIAQRWQHGRGYELRRLPRETFAGVFGEEVGAILHLHIQDTIRRGKRAEMDSYLPIKVLIVASFICFLVCGFLLLRQYRPGLGERNERLEKAAIISALNFVVWLGCYALIWSRQ